MSRREPPTIPSGPTHRLNVDRAVVRLDGTAVSGLINVVGPEVMDRPTWARPIVRAFGFDAVPISAMPAGEVGQGVPRPRNSGLRIDPLEGFWAGFGCPLGNALADFAAKLDPTELLDWVESAIPWTNDGALRH